ncbi:hypothetical protein [uncultured Aquimarina sp.]|uniref:hypothetical protein n=1 Tax=uncultured Aquimarina sp. TaxID=575652 RepID=UPI00263557AB|nr:hypothetical protein [uncultured Aquimarina sp.]
MKNNKTQKISLKKLTVARISNDSMTKIEGGSTVLTSNYWEQGGAVIPFCYIPD